MLSKACTLIAVKAPYTGSFASGRLHAPYCTVLFCSVPFCFQRTEQNSSGNVFVMSNLRCSGSCRSVWVQQPDTPTTSQFVEKEALLPSTSDDSTVEENFSVLIARTL